MDDVKQQPRVAIIGKGALGLLYASLFQDNLGPDAAFFVMDDERFERHARDAYTVNGVPRVFLDVRATEAQPVDLVLVAVKSTGLSAALDLVGGLLGPDTLIVPVLNGITSERRCAARFGWERTVACVAAAMDAARFGSDLRYSKAGQLFLGAMETTPPSAVERAASILRAGGVDVVESHDIVHRQWMKFMANTGVNQVCAAFGITYAQLLADEQAEPFRTYIGAMREVMAVARPAGVQLTEDDMNDYIGVIRSLDPASMPSMAQDCVNRNPTEVDEFAGEVIRRAEAAGLYVPCNRFLLQRIRTIEAGYAR